MASSAEAVELADGSADDGGNVGGVGSNERSPEPSDTEVLIVDEDTRLGDPTPAAPNDGFVKNSNLGCILYKEYGWLRHSSGDKARCPNCKATVTCKGGNTSNLWRHFKACDKKEYTKASGSGEGGGPGKGKRQMQIIFT